MAETTQEQKLDEKPFLQFVEEFVQRAKGNHPPDCECTTCWDGDCLVEHVKALMAQQEWVKVTAETMPTRDKVVLLALPNYTFGGDLQDYDIASGYWDGGDFVAVSSVWGEKDITHWREIGDLPGGEG